MCEIPKFYDERLVTARKPHKCCETGRIIQPGERYWRITGKWDGTVKTFCQSEAAYHFARYINGVGDGPNAGNMSRYDSEWCIPFGRIGADLPNDPEMLAEWDRVCRGEITRCTIKENP